MRITASGGEAIQMKKITTYTIIYGLGFNIVVMAVATLGMFVYSA
jgi:hypothetical protein